jgi:hypothetical protein
VNGKDFIAVRELFRRDPKGGFTRVAAIGEICEKVDPKSLPSLYASGKIQPIVTDVPERAETVKKLRKERA